MPEICSKCYNSLMLCDCDTFQPNITTMNLSQDEARALYTYFIDAGYISREFHPMVHKIIDRLQEFLK